MTHSSDQPTTEPVLSPTCTVMTTADSMFRDKGDGTRVNYYLFSEHEIHANVLAPGTVQGWHHHNQISETLIVTDGSVEARWIDGDQVKTRALTPGDVLSVGSSVHTIANPFDEPAKFCVFRFVPDGVNKQQLIKNDRHTDDPPPT